MVRAIEVNPYQWVVVERRDTSPTGFTPLAVFWGRRAKTEAHVFMKRELDRRMNNADQP